MIEEMIAETMTSCLPIDASQPPSRQGQTCDERKLCPVALSSVTVVDRTSGALFLYL